MVALCLNGVHFSYPGAEILAEITCSVSAATMVGIIGPNGSGKTTLLKCIAAILAPRGTILLHGEDVHRMDRVERARRIGVVPQNGTSAMGATVFETVLMGRRPHTAWRLAEQDVDIAAATLARLGIADLAMRDFSSLSGGQKQLALLARALCQHPRLLLLDEPTSALDIRHQLEVLSLVQQLVREREMAALVAMHDLNLAARYADNVIVLHRGKIHAVGSPTELFSPALIAEVYGVQAQILMVLGRPYVVAIAPSRATPVVSPKTSNDPAIHITVSPP